TWLVADVTQPEMLRDKIREMEQRLGPTDLLVASAGVGIETSAQDLRPAAVAKVIDVNLTGVASSIAAVLPGMRERRRGHLVAISSLASYRGLPLMSAYCASKAGVNALFDALRIELRPFNIACTTICPGWVRTPMTATIASPPPNMMEV